VRVVHAVASYTLITSSPTEATAGIFARCGFRWAAAIASHILTVRLYFMQIVVTD